jgi:dTDP-4-dehydrorhamnose reductase
LTDLPLPKSVYGKSKLCGEINVLQENNKNLIVRTTFYGRSTRRSTLFDYFYDKLLHGNQVVGFTNQFFSPMYIEDLALNLMNAINENVSGIIHMGGAQIISKYDLALEISNQLNLKSGLVIPSEYQNSKHKPYRSLDLSLNSESSWKYVKFDFGLEFGISRSLQRSKELNYD